MEDDIDIYEDLPSFDSKESEKLKDKINELTTKCDTYQQEILDLQKKTSELLEMNKKITNNFSSLLKTAKAEIGRKDRTITELRQEIDNATFRRSGFVKKNQPKPPEKPKEVENYSPFVKLEVMPPQFHQKSRPGSDDETVDTEQKYEPQKIASTVFSERLKKKLLIEEEMERKQKAEAKLAKMAENEAAPVKPITKNAPSNIVQKEFQEVINENTSPEKVVAGCSKNSASTSVASSTKSYKEDDKNSNENRDLAKQILGKRFNKDSSQTDYKRQRMENERKQSEISRHHNETARSKDRFIRESIENNRNSTVTAKLENQRRGSNNREEVERIPRDRTKRNISNHRSRSRTPDRRFGTRRSDRHRTDKYKDYIDEYRRGRQNKRNKKQDNCGKVLKDIREQLEHTGTNRLDKDCKNENCEFPSKKSKSSEKEITETTIVDTRRRKRSKSPERSAGVNKKSSEQRDGPKTRSKDRKSDAVQGKDCKAEVKVDKSSTARSKTEITNKKVVGSSELLPRSSKNEMTNERLASLPRTSDSFILTPVSKEKPAEKEGKLKEMKSQSKDSKPAVIEVEIKDSEQRSQSQTKTNCVIDETSKQITSTIRMTDSSEGLSKSEETPVERKTSSQNITLGSKKPESIATEAKDVDSKTKYVETKCQPQSLTSSKKEITNEEITKKEITNEEITKKEITNKEIAKTGITNEEITKNEITNKKITKKEITNKEITHFEPLTEDLALELLSDKNPEVQKDLTLESFTPVTKQIVANRDNNSGIWTRSGLETNAEEFFSSSDVLESDIGSRSIREEKIENIEKFILNYQENEKFHCTSVNENSMDFEGNDKPGNSTSSILHVLSMDVDDVNVGRRETLDNSLGEQLLIESLSTPVKKNSTLPHLPPEKVALQLPLTSTPKENKVKPALPTSSEENQAKPPLPPTPEDNKAKPPLPPSPKGNKTNPPLPPSPEENKVKPPLPPTPEDTKIKTPSPPIPDNNKIQSTLPSTPEDDKIKPHLPPTSKQIKVEPSVRETTEDEKVKPPLPPTLKGNKVKSFLPPTPEDTKIKPPLPPIPDNTKIKSTLPSTPEVDEIEPPLPPTSKQIKVEPSLRATTEDEKVKPPLPSTLKGNKVRSVLPPTSENNKVKPPLPPAPKDNELKPPLPPTPEDDKIEPPLPPTSKQNKVKLSVRATLEDDKVIPPLSPTLKGNKVKPFLPPTSENIKLKPPLPPTPKDNKLKPPLPPTPEDNRVKPPLSPTPKESKVKPFLPPTPKDDKVEPTHPPTLKENQIKPSLPLTPEVNTVKPPLPPILEESKNKPPSPPISPTRETKQSFPQTPVLIEEKRFIPSSIEKQHLLPSLTSADTRRNTPLQPEATDNQALLTIPSPENKKQTLSADTKKNPLKPSEDTISRLSLVSSPDKKQDIATLQPSDSKQKYSLPPPDNEKQALPSSPSRDKQKRTLLSILASDNKKQSIPLTSARDKNKTSLAKTTKETQEGKSAPSSHTSILENLLTARSNSKSLRTGSPAPVNENIETTKKMSPSKPELKDPTQKITLKQIERPRIPCTSIISKYSRKRRNMVLTDFTASRCIVKSKSPGDNKVNNKVTAASHISTKDLKVASNSTSLLTSGEKSSEKSDNYLDPKIQKLDNNLTTVSKTPTEKTIITESKQTKTVPHETEKKKNPLSQIETALVSEDKIKNSKEHRRIAAETQTKVKSKTESEFQKSESSAESKFQKSESSAESKFEISESSAISKFQKSESSAVSKFHKLDPSAETKNPITPNASESGGTCAALQKTSTALSNEDLGVLSNRKKCIPKEKENQTKEVSKQSRIMVVAKRRRPFNLEDSSTAMTVVSSSKNMNSDKFSTKNIIGQKSSTTILSSPGKNIKCNGSSKSSNTKNIYPNSEKLESAKPIVETSTKRRKRYSTEKR